MAEKDVSTAEKDVSMVAKGQIFNSFVFGTSMITLDKLTGSEIMGGFCGPMVYW